MEPHDFSSSLAQSAIEIVTPVMENAMVLSGHYAKACGRDTILGKDIEYCMKYCAMHTVGDHIGSLFPEVYDSEESDQDDIEEVDEEEPFVPYTGSNVANARHHGSLRCVGKLGPDESVRTDVKKCY